MQEIRGRGAQLAARQGHGKRPLYAPASLLTPLALVAAWLSAACAPSTPPRVVSPTTDTVAAEAPVGAAEDLSVVHLRKGRATSHHLITLRGREQPHVHDRSDLSVFVLRGAVIMHFADREVRVGPGDVVDIPMGAFHWAENVSDEPSVAYAVYSPAFDGQDRRGVLPRGTASPMPSRARTVRTKTR